MRDQILTQNNLIDNYNKSDSSMSVALSKEGTFHEKSKEFDCELYLNFHVELQVSNFVVKC